MNDDDKPGHPATQAMIDITQRMQDDAERAEQEGRERLLREQAEHDAAQAKADK